MPYVADRAGIILNTAWGADKINHQLYLDNNSPTWGNDRVVQNNRSITRSKNTSYRTSVVNGSFIRGDVYFCDSISIEQVTFNHLDFYKISGKSYAGKGERGDGAIGENIMSKGIWKIDFKNQKITFDSGIDSIGNLIDAQLLPSKFSEHAIAIELLFPHEKTQVFQLDLGFNGNLIMPLEEFGTFEAGKKISRDSFRLSTPSDFELVENMTAEDTVLVNKKLYWVFLNANKSVKYKLVGLGFFQRFEFLILDYLHNEVYISKKALY